MDYCTGRALTQDCRAGDSKHKVGTGAEPVRGGGGMVGMVTLSVSGNSKQIMVLAWTRARNITWLDGLELKMQEAQLVMAQL